MKNKIIALLCVILAAVVSFAACDESGAAGGGHKHTFSTVWKSNETEHWHPASCEHGENKGDLAPHADADEDGVCDVCAFECGHDHAFAEAWTNNETHHWHAPTCSHTDEKGSYGLHKDENIDALCDDCSAHVHILDGAGFCTGCNKEIIPVVETDIGSVVSATTARLNNIISGRVNYSNTIKSSVTGQITASLAHTSDYLLGLNGVCISRNLEDMDGNLVVECNWIPRVSAENIVGVFTETVAGTLTTAYPAAFGPDNLLGYYFTASTLADGYAPETLLYALYEKSIDDVNNKVSDLKVQHNDELNSYSFSYNVLVINTDTAEGEDDGVDYYEVSVVFTYDDDYTLLTLDVSVDCYTNSLKNEAENDYTYDQATQTIKMKDTASADNYHYTVTQVKGTRTNIEMQTVDMYTPTDFEIYTDEACTNKATDIEVAVGDFSKELYFAYTPEDTFISFLDLKITVTDKDGNSVSGLTVNLTGHVVSLLPTVAGEYTVNFTAGNIVKIANVTVLEEAKRGEMRFDVVSKDNNTFDGGEYTFVASSSGTYTFYLPVGVSVQLYDKETEEFYIAFDFNDHPYRYDDPIPEGTYSWTVDLRKSEAYTLIFMFRDKNVTYTIGYDFAK